MVLKQHTTIQCFSVFVKVMFLLASIHAYFYCVIMFVEQWWLTHIVTSCCGFYNVAGSAFLLCISLYRYIHTHSYCTCYMYQLELFYFFLQASALHKRISSAVSHLYNCWCVCRLQCFLKYIYSFRQSRVLVVTSFEVYLSYMIL